MTLAEAIRAAERADKEWQAYLDAVGIDRWSPGSSARGTRAGELYENKVMADRIMHSAFAKARGETD
jgi:hypothetical protein